MISMMDCSGDEYHIWRAVEFGKLEPLTIHGTWHNLNCPLYIKVTDPEGNIVFDGYGEDH
ncbi:MAG: hypothetical protein ACI4HI_18480 [Lachnospiraceae bacterium]